MRWQGNAGVRRWLQWPRVTLFHYPYMRGLSRCLSKTDQWLEKTAEHSIESQAVIGGDQAYTGLIRVGNGLVLNAVVQVSDIAGAEAAYFIGKRPLEYVRQLGATVAV